MAKIALNGLVMLSWEPTPEAVDDEGMVREFDNQIESIAILKDVNVEAKVLENVLYRIVPEIPEARESDVRFIREIANSSAAALGYDPKVLLRATDVVEVGKSLVMEGFKETLILIAKAAWTVIINFVDGFLVLLTSVLDQTMSKMNKIQFHTSTIIKTNVADDAVLPPKVRLDRLVNSGAICDAGSFHDRLMVIKSSVDKWAYSSHATFNLLWSSLGFSDKVSGDFESSLRDYVTRTVDNLKSGIDPRLLRVAGIDRISTSDSGLKAYDKLKQVVVIKTEIDAPPATNVSVGGLISVVELLHSYLKTNRKVFSTSIGYYRLTARNLRLQTPILLRRYSGLLEEIESPEVREQQRPYAEALAYCQRDSILLSLRAYTLSIAALKDFVDELDDVMKFVAGRH